MASRSLEDRVEPPMTMTTFSRELALGTSKPELETSKPEVLVIIAVD